jgi:hypothetical protein
MALQRQHHAGEQGGQPHHWQGEITDIDELPQNLAGIERGADAMTDRTNRESREPAYGRHKFEKSASEKGERIHKIEEGLQEGVKQGETIQGVLSSQRN